MCGRLRLAFETAAGRTALTVREQQPPLRVVRAFSLDDGSALVHLHNLSGGVLGGDRLLLEIDLAPEATVQVTSTGATRVYRCRPDGAGALQEVDIRLGRNALLEYLPDALIPFSGSRYYQQTRIELADGAGLFWWEMLAPGRQARGELFAYDALESGVQLHAGSLPIALERIYLEPARRPLCSPARLGPYTHVGSLYICRVGFDEQQWLEWENSLAELAARLSRPGVALWAVSSLAAHGLIIRAVSQSAQHIRTGFVEFWRAGKRLLYGREAVLPRKIW